MVGNKVWFKVKGTGKRELWGTVEDGTYIMVGDDDPCKHMIQRIRPSEGETWDGSQYYLRNWFLHLLSEEAGPDRLGAVHPVLD